MPDRLPPRRPEELSESQRAVYDAITAGRRSQGPRLFDTTGANGELLGPFAAMVAHPAVGDPLQRLGEALRYETSLPALAREVVILSVASRRRSEYEWYAHVAVARSLGMPEDLIDQLRSGEPPRALDDQARAAWMLADVLLRQQPVTDELFRSVEGWLGVPGVVEVVSLVGYYGLLAQLLEVFHLGAPDDVPSSSRL